MWFLRIIGCPFDACTTFHKPSGKWHVNVDVAHHNHTASTNPCAQIEICHLTPAQFSKLKNLSKAGLSPSKILRKQKIQFMWPSVG
ncbi:uncharacterized protein VP01_7g20 [Puccinia sorghi]|uniref:Uncharacterized protein n=1 Tax=Puccinia sorghi TaxID=27349 RepID=A0A0L6UCP6_9BASI|nr:uncharacterized protein VP01_7g20 [Puccinia sorghi]